MDLLEHTAIPLGSSGRWAPSVHFWGATGSGIALVHCHIGGEYWAMELLQYTATVMGSCGQSISFDTTTLPRAVHNGSPSAHCNS